MKSALRTVIFSFALTAALLRLEVLPSAWGDPATAAQGGQRG